MTAVYITFYRQRKLQKINEESSNNSDNNHAFWFFLLLLCYLFFGAKHYLHKLLRFVLQC